MNFVGLRTLAYKEILRFSKVYLQTLIAPLVTSVLYLLVFAHILEDRMEVFPGIGYTAFLVPGLIMMSAIQNSFANSSSSLIQSKISGNLIFLLVSPLSNLEIYLAFMFAAVLRGLLVGLGVYFVGLWFGSLPVHSVMYVLAFALLGSAACATMGIIAGIWGEKFDQMAGVTNFIINPLSFLAGVFYSVDILPAEWRAVSYLNPFFYMVDGFRYGMLGQSDVDPRVSLIVTASCLAILAAITLRLLHSGYKLRA